MSLTHLKEKVLGVVATRRMSITMLMLSGLVGMASAADLNATVSPIIYEVVKLFVLLLNVVLSGLPLIITIAIISFILGILAMILGKLKLS